MRFAGGVEAAEDPGRASSGTTGGGPPRESLPRSTSCIAAAPVIAFVIEAIHTTVSRVIGAGLPISRWPKAPS
jgi:hypothetical protein